MTHACVFDDTSDMRTGGADTYREAEVHVSLGVIINIELSVPVFAHVCVCLCKMSCSDTAMR